MPENHIAQRLNKLFNTIRKPNGRPYTNREIAEKIGLSPSTISRLRTGRETNPGYKTLYHISQFFGVDIDYFSPDDDGRLPRPPQTPPPATTSNAVKLQLVEEILEKLLILNELIQNPQTEPPSQHYPNPSKPL